MDPLNTLVLLGTFVTLIALGTPIAVGIGLSAFVALLLTMSFETATITVAQRVAAGLDRFTLLAIPFFTLIAKSSKHENAKQPHWAQARSSCWGTRSPPL